jgi:F-type H+-transporting ATPase subunit b
MYAKTFVKIFSLILVISVYFGGVGQIQAATPTPTAEAIGAADDNGAPVVDGHAEEAVTDEAHAEEEKQGIPGMFGLDWKLFIAQLVNFGIVLFVLWRFVFKPVAKGLAERTNKIEQSLKDAQQITEDKQTFESWKTAEMSKVRQEAAGIITQAKQEAEGVKASILDQAKAEQSRIVQQAQAQLENEKQKALNEIKGQIADMVVSASETILREKLDDKKDKQLIEQALQKANG